MSAIIFLVGPNEEAYGTVQMGSDKVEWEYTGPDPRGEVAEYLKSVEDKEAYDWHEEVHDDMDVGEEAFNEMYIMEVYLTLDSFDYPHRVLSQGL